MHVSIRKLFNNRTAMLVAGTAVAWLAVCAPVCVFEPSRAAEVSQMSGVHDGSAAMESCHSKPDDDSEQGDAGMCCPEGLKVISSDAQQVSVPVYSVLYMQDMQAPMPSFGFDWVAKPVYLSTAVDPPPLKFSPVQLHTVILT